MSIEYNYIESQPCIFNLKSLITYEFDSVRGLLIATLRMKMRTDSSFYNNIKWYI